ncbi:MAG: DUF3883 domain-containing protein [Cenarchaeum sp. SB0663_bin_5]|nr:DUF3883 domain-containing protein [Cenarchaeum sp. SB0663_bin_5]MYH04114.1 DUF3883 domain-containing protein [Cenarchaeum sp. SB0675_bin_21]MYL11684.1 DUF3883 domain-containing protein [Cenarchaeum sp. SB0669_bin_11]
MMRNINDLSVILSTVGNFGNGIRKKDLFSMLYDKHPYIQWYIHPRELLNTAIRLDLLTASNDRISLTNHGRIIQSMQKPQVIDLSKNQSMYIAENCILTNKNFSHLAKFLKSFVFDRQYRTMIYNTADYPMSYMNDMEMLTQLGIIRKKNAVWLLNRKYVGFIDEISCLQTQGGYDTRAFTQECLERILREQREVGKLAEELSMKYEKDRLGKKLLHEESSRVRQVSTVNAGIGYDIESFKQRTSSMRHDLFIEVKARKHSLNSFIMSNNEIQVAKRLGTKYVVYFWHGLAYGNPAQPTQIIEDPFNTLEIRECDNCLSYIVDLDKYEQLI